MKLNQERCTHDDNTAKIALEFIPVIPVIDTEDLVLCCVSVVGQAL
jgi:hypothetical protein